MMDAEADDIAPESAAQRRDPIKAGTIVSRVRSLGKTPRWVTGMMLASWRYLFHRPPVERIEQEAFETSAAEPLAPAEQDGVQPASDGSGMLYLRRYEARIVGARLGCEDVVEELMTDLNRASLVEVAVFKKRRGRAGTMNVGDEYVVRMPGPWDGPVRVVDCCPTSFRFATLSGHMEAGEIEFGFVEDDGEALVFRIESWARSGNRLFGFLYDRLWVPREMQMHLWVQFCARVAELAGGRLDGPVKVLTRRHV